MPQECASGAEPTGAIRARGASAGMVGFNPLPAPAPDSTFHASHLLKIYDPHAYALSYRMSTHDPHQPLGGTWPTSRFRNQAREETTWPQGAPASPEKKNQPPTDVVQITKDAGEAQQPPTPQSHKYRKALESGIRSERAGEPKVGGGATPVLPSFDVPPPRRRSTVNFNEARRRRSSAAGLGSSGMKLAAVVSFRSSMRRGSKRRVSAAEGSSRRQSVDVRRLSTDTRRQSSAGRRASTQQQMPPVSPVQPQQVVQPTPPATAPAPMRGGDLRSVPRRPRAVDREVKENPNDQMSQWLRRQAASILDVDPAEFLKSIGTPQVEWTFTPVQPKLATPATGVHQVASGMKHWEGLRGLGSTSIIRRTESITFATPAQAAQTVSPVNDAGKVQYEFGKRVSTATEPLTAPMTSPQEAAVAVVSVSSMQEQMFALPGPGVTPVAAATDVEGVGDPETWSAGGSGGDAAGGNVSGEEDEEEEDYEEDEEYEEYEEEDGDASERSLGAEEDEECVGLMGTHRSVSRSTINSSAPRTPIPLPERGTRKLQADERSVLNVKKMKPPSTPLQAARIATPLAPASGDPQGAGAASAATRVTTPPTNPRRFAAHAGRINAPPSSLRMEYCERAEQSWRKARANSVLKQPVLATLVRHPANFMNRSVHRTKR